MGKPEWQEYPLEPWAVGDSGTVLDAEEEPVTSAGFAIYLDSGGLRAGYQMRDRTVACVNALAGIRNPAAVREVIEALGAVRKFSISAVFDAKGSYTKRKQGELRELHERARLALGALDAEPEE